MDRDASTKLLEAILAGTPRLDGAACVGQYQLFDDLPGVATSTHHQEQIRLAEAAQVCAGMPRDPALPERHRGRHRGGGCAANGFPALR